jgi:hypothetical protein
VRPAWACDHQSQVSEELRRCAECILDNGVPDTLLGGRYRALDQMRVVASSGGPVIQFGSARSGLMCVEPSSGNVVALAHEGGPSVFVNVSVKHFADATFAVTEMFPFYSADDEDENDDILIDVGNTIAEKLRRIDPESMVRDRFWSTLVDDIQMGNFHTEDVLENY